MGPSMISRENGLLRGSVLLNVRGRDVGSFVEQAQRAVAREVKLPSGYYVEWSGQYENQLSARRRLMLVIPAVFLIMSVLLYKIYDSLKEALHVMLAVPFALTGGIFLLKVLGYNFFRGRVGGLYRAVWYRGTNWRGDGHLPGGSGRTQEGSDGQADHTRPPRSSHGRRASAAASEGDDRLDGGCRTAAVDVVKPHRGASFQLPTARPWTT